MGHQYKNLTQAILAFENKSIQCTRQSFPVNSKDIFSTLTHRGQPTTSKRAPVFVKPDGKRYNVNGKHVEYVNGRLILECQQRMALLYMILNLMASM